MSPMRPPFPGMDPWLEHPDLWPDVHNSLITAIRDVLMPMVLPRYVVRVESRTTVLTGLDVDRLYRPDVAIQAAEPVRADVGAWRGGPRAITGQGRHRGGRAPIDEDEIEETFLTIQELPGRKLVTAIEVLSPTNKKTKDARRNTWKSDGT